MSFDPGTPSMPLERLFQPLQPCPFCGSNHHVETHWEADVTCSACDAFAPFMRWQMRRQLEMALVLGASQAAREEAKAILREVADDVQLPPIWQLEVAAELRLARRWFPKPDLLVLALAEEAGEVVKAALDLRVGKPTASHAALRKELIQTIAMAVRLLEEGDPLVIPALPGDPPKAHSL